MFGEPGTQWFSAPKHQNPCRTAAVPAADGHHCIAPPSYKASPIPRFVLFRFLFSFITYPLLVDPNAFPYAFRKTSFFLIVKIQSLLIEYVFYIAVNPFRPFRSLLHRRSPATWPWPYPPPRRFEARQWRREWSWDCVRGWEHRHGCPES